MYLHPLGGELCVHTCTLWVGSCVHVPAPSRWGAVCMYLHPLGGELCVRTCTLWVGMVCMAGSGPGPGLG